MCVWVCVCVGGGAFSRTPQCQVLFLETSVCVCVTYDSSRLGGLDEGQGAVVGLFRNVDKALLQLVLLQDAMQLVQKPHPLVPLVVAVRQDQDGGLVAAGGRQLGRRHLQVKGQGWQVTEQGVGGSFCR